MLVHQLKLTSWFTGIDLMGFVQGYGRIDAYGITCTTMMKGERTHVVERPFENERLAWEAYGNEILETPPFTKMFGENA